MKSIFYYFRKFLKTALGLFFLCIPILAFSGEFVVINQTLNWTMSSASGFYFFPVPSGAPSNWESPEDYYNGQFYTRYEVLSVATSEAFGIQFGIWQNQPGETYDSETMENLRTISTGTGTVITNNSSPSLWWRNYDGVDFGRVYDFDRLGIVLWCLSPQIFIAPASWDGDPDVWDTRNRWFPCSIKVTVVAVSAGSTFSGWHNYVVTKPPTPSYTINYYTEKTNQTVPSTDEYSYSVSMSPAYSGTGVALTLQPGQDVYFRTKAQGANPASDIQTLDVPARPGVPSVDIDFTNEITSSAILSTMEYAFNSSMSSATTGTDAAIPVIPGTDLYFRKKATASQFCSLVQTLDVPARPAAPAITIDFSGEVTSPAASSMEYSVNSSMMPATAGTNSAIPLTPGTDLYFRYKATGSQFSSVIQTLDVPARPSAPSYSIDYTAEKTNQNVSSDIEYAMSGTFTDPVNGTGNQITVTPGQDLFFRKKATSSSFISSAFHLIVPIRPDPCSVSVDYFNEKTNEIFSSAVEFSDDITMAGSSICSNTKVDLEPGVDLYFRIKATDNTFSSVLTTLDVPARPSVPDITIDYFTERTSVIDSTVEWSLDSLLSSATQGNGYALDVTPGIDMVFRVIATLNTFSSLPQHISVPERPLKPSFSIDYIHETTMEPVGENIEYSKHSDFSDAVMGQGEEISIDAGQNMYFKKVADSISFKSDTSVLLVPGRCSLSYSGADTITDDSFEVYAVLVDTTAAFDLDYLLIANGTARDLGEGNTFYIDPISGGLVSISIPPNVFPGGNFASNMIHVFYVAPVSVSSVPAKENFKIYPNPSHGIVCIFSNSDKPFTVDIVSVEGRVLQNHYLLSGKPELNLSYLNKGLYFLKMVVDDTIYIQKLILE